MGRLWLDSSVTRKPGTLHDLSVLAKARGVSLIVHAHVHLEMCRHLRCKHGAGFSPAFIDSYLRLFEVHIADVTLDRSLAERWAERLNGRYPSHEAWENAKRSTIGGELRADFRTEPGKMPMTTDWWVALQVEDQPEDRIAVDDDGGEWAALRAAQRAMDARTAKQWLESLPVMLP